MSHSVADHEGGAGSPLRPRIVEAAAALYAQFGFRGATTRLIAERAGVNEVTLFRAFGSKAALLTEVVRHHIAEREFRALPAEPVDPARELLDWARFYMSHVRDRRGMIMQSMGAIAEHPEVAEPICEGRARETAALHAYFDALRARGFARADFDTPSVVSMFAGALFSDAVGRDLFPGTYPDDADAATAAYVALTLRAIGADAPSSADPVRP